MKLHDIPDVWKKAMQDNPTSQFSIKAGAVAKQLLEKAELQKRLELAQQVSKIGDRLAKIFNNRVAAVPCSSCVAAIRSLNRMTPEQVAEKEDELVAEILTRAQSSMPTWWQKMLVYADQMLHIGASDHLIRLWLREACLEETNATVEHPAD